VHHDLIALLDVHLAELTALRRVLAAPRPVYAGERWNAAEASVRSAERYSQAVGALLDPTPV
jgi:hypothetical protein